MLARLFRIPLFTLCFQQAIARTDSDWQPAPSNSAEKIVSLESGSSALPEGDIPLVVNQIKPLTN